MNVVKRNGEIVNFNKTKIKQAVAKAMKNGSKVVKPDIARMVAHDVQDILSSAGESVTITQIEQEVIQRLIHYGQNETALAYEKFRTLAAMRREIVQTDESVIGLITGENEEVGRENSNKNAKALNVQRDLIAGEVSKDLAMRKLLPTRVAEAQMLGHIHVHDLDYAMQKSFNCCLTDLESMLGDGTIINGRWIDPQSKFLTAMTVATQIAAAMSSAQYGGNTFSLAHLSKYAKMSKETIRQEVEADFMGMNATDGQKEKAFVRRWQKELQAGVQTFNYQLNSIAGSNGRLAV